MRSQPKPVSTFSSLGEMAGGASSPLIGILFGNQALGAAIGPVTGGVLADHYGLSIVFYFLAGTIVIANLFVFFTPTPERRSAV